MKRDQEQRQNLQGGENGYLEYGNPHLSSGRLKVSTVTGNMVEEGEGLTRVREAMGSEGSKVTETSSKVPALPSLDTSRLNAGGLRRLQQHLERLGGAEEGEGGGA